MHRYISIGCAANRIDGSLSASSHKIDQCINSLKLLPVSIMTYIPNLRLKPIHSQVLRKVNPLRQGAWIQRRSQEIPESVSCAFQFLARMLFSRPGLRDTFVRRAMSLSRGGHRDVPSPLCCLFPQVLQHFPRRPRIRSSWIIFSHIKDEVDNIPHSNHVRPGGLCAQVP